MFSAVLGFIFSCFPALSLLPLLAAVSHRFRIVPSLSVQSALAVLSLCSLCCFSSYSCFPSEFQLFPLGFNCFPSLFGLPSPLQLFPSTVAYVFPQFELFPFSVSCFSPE